MFMEVKNSENNGFIIYCEKHAPLKVKRTLESKVKTYVDDISKFCRAIEKFYLSYRYKFDSVPNFEVQNYSLLRQTKKIKKELKKDKASPVNQLLDHPYIAEIGREIAKFVDFSHIWVLNMQTSKTGANNGGNTPKIDYTFQEYQKPKKTFLKSVIPKTHGIWRHMAYKKGTTAKMTYKKYKKLIDPIKKPGVILKESPKKSSARK